MLKLSQHFHSSRWVFKSMFRASSTITNASYCFRTEDNIIKSTESLEYPDADLFTFYSKKFVEYGDKTALVDENTGKSASYVDLVENGKRLSSFFEKKGYKFGDRIAIHTPNSLEYCYSTMGTLASGLTLNTANSVYTNYELKQLLTNSTPKVLITSGKQLEQARQCIEGTDTDLLICVDDVNVNDSGVLNLSDILANGDPDFTKDLSNFDPKNEAAFLLYSSGTTGLPKGVMTSHHAFLSNIIQLTQRTFGPFPMTSLLLLPMYHLGGLLCDFFLQTHNKSKVHIVPGFDPVQFLTVIQDNKVERLTVVPPIAVFLLNHPIVDKYDLSSVRSIVFGAAPMDEIAVNQFQRKFPNAILQQAYGMTETNLTHVQSIHSHLQKPGSCGAVTSDTMSKIISLQNGEALGPNQKGEVCMKGIQTMLGYYKNEKATNAMIDSDGWVRSGDLGYYDEDLDFFVIDRLKELIKVKGFQVAPAELEDLLLGHDEILDSCVIGIPCDRSGEIPRAYVVKKADSNLSEDEVKSYVAEHLSKHKHLAGGVEFVEQVPKSASGKILRRILKDQYLSSK